MRGTIVGEASARGQLLADARDQDACTHARVCHTQCRKVKGVGGWIDRAGGSTSVLSLVRFRRGGVSLDSPPIERLASARLREIISRLIRTKGDGGGGKSNLSTIALR